MQKCYFFLSSSIIKWLQWIQQCMHKTFWRRLSLSSFTSVHLSVVSDSFNPMDCSTPGFPVHHQLPKLTQIHVHQVSDAIQPSHPLSSPSPVFNLYSLYSFPYSPTLTSIHVISFINSTIVWSLVKQQGGNTALPIERNLIKNYWAWPHPSEQDPFSPKSVSPIKKLS